MDIYALIQQDVEAKKDNDTIRHGVPHTVDARRDGLYSAYQKALDLVVELRTEIARKEGK